MPNSSVRLMMLVGTVLIMSLAAGCGPQPQLPEAASSPAGPSAPSSPCGDLTDLDQDLPELTFTPLDGEPLTLADLQGRVVILDFWAMLCSACVEGLDHYQQDAELTNDPQVQLLAITLDRSETAVRRFVAERGWTFPVVLITEQQRAVFLGQGNVVLPQGRVIDPQGRLRYRLNPDQMKLETLKCLAAQLQEEQ